MPDRNRLIFQGFLWFGYSSLFLACAKIIVHLQFFILPLFFLLLGVGTYLWRPQKALRLFLFLFPLIHSLPDLFFNGYPYNYLATGVFYLAGLFVASRLSREEPDFRFPGYPVYFLFLLLVWISAGFVLFRWSNLLHSPLAFFRDTPVSPSGERVSFATIFPVASLFMLSLGPWIFSLLRRNRIDFYMGCKWMMPGFCLSVILAGIQKNLFPDLLSQAWWSEGLHQSNGGFSDFNGLGLISGVCFLIYGSRFLDRWIQGERKPLPLILNGTYCLFSLAGIQFSGSRTALLFPIAGLFLLIFSRRIGFRVRLLIVVGCSLLFLLVGGQLKRRMLDMTGNIRQLFSGVPIVEKLDEISNRRIDMIRHSIPLVALNPLGGVGIGNFLFCFKTAHFGKGYYEDMPLNQYLLILDELGFIGLFVFFWFLWRLWRGTHSGLLRILFSLTFLSFFFGNPLWLPEGTILLWFLIADLGSNRGERRPSRAVILVLLAIFFAAQFFFHSRLDPLPGIQDRNIPYEYGFWYSETNPDGLQFRWTNRASGLYLSEGVSTGDLRVICRAPLHLLPGRKQVVRIYWRGHLFKVFTFYNQGERSFSLSSFQGEAGFLEFRVVPPFRLKRMNLGAEDRNLGVQIAGVWDSTLPNAH